VLYAHFVLVIRDNFSENGTVEVYLHSLLPPISFPHWKTFLLQEKNNEMRNSFVVALLKSMVGATIQ
jgi:hypothetical protein